MAYPVILPPTPEETAIIESVRQLELWHERGYEPQIYGHSQGWAVLLDQTKWGQRAINEREHESLLRFTTRYHPTFIAAVQKAMEVIK
jgi:hypothetical protein